MSRRKSILVNCGILLLPVLSVLIVFVAGELGFRLYQRWDAAFHSDPRLGKTNGLPRLSRLRTSEETMSSMRTWGTGVSEVTAWLGRLSVNIFVL